MAIRALDWMSNKLGIDVLGTAQKVDEKKMAEEEQMYIIDEATGMWKPKPNAPAKIWADYEEKMKEMREAANPTKPPPPPPPPPSEVIAPVTTMPTERYVADGYFSGTGSETSVPSPQ